MSIEYRALGPLEVSIDGQNVQLGGTKQRTLLALLLTYVNHAVSTDRLVDEIWDGGSGAVHSLRVHVSELRKLVEPDRVKGDPWRRIETVEDGYRLNAEAGEFDVSTFEQLVTDERWHDALAIWRGEVFGGLESRSSLQSESARLDELRLVATERRVEADLEAGQSADLIGEIQDLVRAHPYREVLRGQLMLALYRAGRQTDALREYKSFSEILGNELGLEPGPELRHLEERILLHDESLAARPEQPNRGNLPAATTSFIGREADLDTGAQLLDRTRLLTLTGPGGVGKTRLSIQLAHLARDAFPDGVWLVELASLRDQELVAGSLAEELGVDPQPGRAVEDTLGERIGDKRLLIILDNCEHLLDAAARLADSLLRRCPHLTMIATSREPLGATGETQYRVPPLQTPTDGAGISSESARLFVDRAQAQDRTFALTEANAQPLLSICTHLDGIPLAIELAAVRVGSLTLAQIAKSLEDRFSLLTGGSRTSAARQRTLEATLDWSHDLLTGNERVLLRRLSVFRGSFNLDAVAALDRSMKGDGQTIDLMSNLVSKSLVGTERTNGEMRYEMLETVRQYTRRKLRAAGEEAEAIAWHTHYFTGVLKKAEPHLSSAEQLGWLEDLEADHDNLRAALERSYSSRDITASVRLVGHLSLFWFLHSNYREGNLWLNRLIPELDTIEPDLSARLLIGAGRLLRRDQEAVALAHLERAYEIAESADRPSLAAWAQVYIAMISAMEARFELAAEAADAAQSRFQDLGQIGGVGFSMWVGAVAKGLKAREPEHFDPVAYDESFTVIRAILDAAVAVGDRNFLGHVLYSLGVYSVDKGARESAGYLADSITALREIGNKACTAHSVDQVARYAINTGDSEAACRILAATRSIRTSLGVDGHKTERDLWQEAKDLVDAAIDRAEESPAWNNGYTMGFDEAVDYALEVLDQ